MEGRVRRAVQGPTRLLPVPPRPPAFLPPAALTPLSIALHTPQPGLSAAEAFLATNFPSVDVSLGQLERELEHALNDFMDQLFRDTVEEDSITGMRVILPLGGTANGSKGKGRLDDDGAIVRSSGLTIRSTCPAAIPSELAETAITDPGPSNAPTMTGKPARPRPRALAISTGSGGCGSLPATPPPAPTLAQAPPLLRLSTASPSDDSPIRPLTSSSCSLLQPPQRPNLLPVSASPAIPSTEASAFPDALFGPARPATPPPVAPISSSTSVFAQPLSAFGAANAPQPVPELTSSSSFGQPAYTPSESAFGQASFAGASTLTPAIPQQSTFGSVFGEKRNTWAETPSACNEDVEMCDSDAAPAPGTWDNPMNPALHPAHTPAFGIPTSASPSAWLPPTAPPSVVYDKMVLEVEPALHSAQQSIFDLMTGPRATQAAGYVVPLVNVPADVWEEEARRAHARQLASVQQQQPQPPPSSIMASHARADLWNSTRGRGRERGFEYRTTFKRLVEFPNGVLHFPSQRKLNLERRVLPHALALILPFIRSVLATRSALDTFLRRLLALPPLPPLKRSAIV
ncbi:hypothetical protein MKEN_00540200 [Mycena kentingensis (nom. inval.)]|nr:hypothetical protein MKEN_00540200 [Mycena kentingensis (nom. inval.)]